MRFIRVPRLSKFFYPSIIESFPLEKGKLFFTFDDGPEPEVTPQILDILKQYKAKATFFCLGEKVEKYPEIYNSIIEQNHSIGNHTYSHLHGFYNKSKYYINDVKKASSLIKSNLFRPPYGKISPLQYFILKRKFKIIFWNVLTYDFDPTITISECINIVLNNSKDGSIIVFHDSLKAKNIVLQVLPIVLKELGGRGFSFDKI